MVFPQAYHITFGVYMGRPPGSSKPHVDTDHNTYGTPLPPPDPEWEVWSRANAREFPVKLTLEQRKCVVAAVTDLAARYKWKIYSIAANSDHVHVVIGAPRDGENLRDAIKAVASKWLNKAFGERTWWAEKGSAKYLWERNYFLNAIKYVKDKRDF